MARAGGTGDQVRLSWILCACALTIGLLGVGARVWSAADGGILWPLVVFGIGVALVWWVALSAIARMSGRPVRDVLPDLWADSLRGVRAVPSRVRQWCREALAPHRRRS